jgi:hypothetical protein
MRERAWTVRVGEGTSTARYSVRNPAEVVAFLGRLAASVRDPVGSAAAAAVSGEGDSRRS